MREGQYFYAPYRDRWGVWVNHNCDGGVSRGIFVVAFEKRDEARQFVYEKNGWLR